MIAPLLSRDSFYAEYVWIGFNLLDVITTHLGFLEGHVEGNPLPALIVALSSPTFLPVYKLSAALLWLAAVLWLARRRPRIKLALRLGNILVFATVCWNLLLLTSV